MFIAHLPGAYLTFRTLAPVTLPRTAFIAGCLGGLAPDLDLLWFYLVDQRQTHHHGYFSHLPAFWLGLLVLAMLLHRHRASRLSTAWICSCLGALLHLALDTPIGEIAWGWPVSAQAGPLITVPARYPQWVLNFLIHWSFLIELALCAAAALVFARSRLARKRKNPGRSLGPGSIFSKGGRFPPGY